MGSAAPISCVASSYWRTSHIRHPAVRRRPSVPLAGDGANCRCQDRSAQPPWASRGSDIATRHCWGRSLRLCGPVTRIGRHLRRELSVRRVKGELFDPTMLHGPSRRTEPEIAVGTGRSALRLPQGLCTLKAQFIGARLQGHYAPLRVSVVSFEAALFDYNNADKTVLILYNNARLYTVQCLNREEMHDYAFTFSFRIPFSSPQCAATTTMEHRIVPAFTCPDIQVRAGLVTLGAIKG